MSYKVKLEIFEGPFDLLVYLIESAKMDIYDIKVAEITSQYLEYIEEIKNVDVDTASEFMVLAANLIEIKSKLLLPKKKTVEDESEEDPRNDLVQRIIEYKKFKKAAEIFQNMEENGQRVVAKPAEDISEFINEPFENFIFDGDKLFKVFKSFMSKKKKVDEIKYYENVKKKKITSQARVGFIRNLFHLNSSKVYDFHSTLENNDNYDKALSFTTIMEMVKQKQITADQERIFGEILLAKGEDFEQYNELGQLENSRGSSTTLMMGASVENEDDKKKMTNSRINGEQ